MEFLVQTEENLAVEISGNYHSLMEQQKAHEVAAGLARKRSYCVIDLHFTLICFLVIPSGDVQSAADPALYYQRWTEDAGAGSGGRPVRHFHLGICPL